MEWKHQKIRDDLSNISHNFGPKKRKEMSLHNMGQQLLTIRQLISLRKEQHKKEIKELEQWEDSIAQHLKPRLSSIGLKGVDE